MGLIVDVFRWSLGDCSNDGISKQANMLCIVNVEGPSKPRPGVPAALLVEGNVKGQAIIVPAELAYGRWQCVKSQTMAGGSFGYTSDSRFIEAVEMITGENCQGPISIHDRIE